VHGGNDDVLLARSNKREYPTRNFLPPLSHKQDTKKNRCDHGLPDFFFSRENRFLYLIDETSSHAHRKTHCHHVACFLRKKTSPRWKKQPFACRFSSRFSIDVFALANERANHRVSRNKSRCCRDSPWTSEVENWTTLPCLVHASISCF